MSPEEQSAFSDLSDELADVRLKLSSETSLRVTAEAIAHERLRVIESLEKRADSAEKAREEAMRLFTASKVDVPPDIKQFKIAPMQRRQRKSDIFFGPKFIDVAKKIGTTDEPLKVPMPEDEVVQ